MQTKLYEDSNDRIRRLEKELNEYKDHIAQYDKWAHLRGLPGPGDKWKFNDLDEYSYRTYAEDDAVAVATLDKRTFAMVAELFGIDYYYAKLPLKNTESFRLSGYVRDIIKEYYKSRKPQGLGLESFIKEEDIETGPDGP